jgi:hypothetical protein
MGLGPRERSQTEHRNANPNTKQQSDSHADPGSPQLPSDQGAEDRA